MIPPRMVRSSMLLALFVAGVAGLAAAQPTITAVRVEQSPTIDGDVAGDPAWRSAVPITGFYQEQPDEGQPATERTEVRVVLTGSTIYVCVICYEL